MNNSVYIIGCGSSLTGFNFEKLKGLKTICANGSVFDVPDPTNFITIDYTFLKKLGQKQRDKFDDIKCTKYFVLAMDNGISEKNGKFIDKKHNITYDLKPYDVIIKSHHAASIGGNFRNFKHGNNSGYCALQLAIILGYKTINLLGIDLCVGAKSQYHKYYRSFTKKLPEFYEQWTNAINATRNIGIKIQSCSKISRLNKIIDYVHFKDTL